MELSGMCLHPLHRKFQRMGGQSVKDLEATLRSFRSKPAETLSDSDIASSCVSVHDSQLLVSEGDAVIFKLSLVLLNVDSGLDRYSGLPAIWLQSPGAEVLACVLVSRTGEAAAASALEAICACGAIHKDLRCVYKLQSDVLGKGNFGSVRLVSSKGSSSEFAAKLLETESLPMVSVGGSTQAIPQEAVMLLAAQAHPNILRFLGIFGTREASDDTAAKDQDRPLQWALVTECCPGGDLFTMVKSEGPCRESHATNLMTGVLAALKHLHHRGLVHRDVKAENVLLRADGVPVLGDFGICVSVANDPNWKSFSESLVYTTPEVLAKTGASLANEVHWNSGSPGYIAPEILLKTGKYGPKIDVFAAGVVYYFLLSGDLPFGGGDIASTLRRNSRCKVKFDANPSFQHVSTDCLCLVKLFLSRLPEDRPSSIEALALISTEDCLKKERDVVAVRRPASCPKQRRPRSDFHRRYQSN
mmetsp:Transcript_160105/g.292314  ORF Transcript_160105/g.292314 Transcript_160105/m.292314 type:complete len:473 (+) Transcript_160105:77-1495(+)